MKRRWALLFALATSACATQTPHAPENARTDPGRAQLIVLREAEVESLRKRVNEHRTTELTDELCDALLALSSAYRAEARVADPGADSVPPPAEREEPSSAEESDAPVENAPAPLPARDEAALARLAPKSRALLALADRRAFEAVACLDEWHDGEALEAEARRAARRARVLDDLGQHQQARRAWLTVIRRSTRAQDKVDAWLVFSGWYVSQKKIAEAQSATDEAAAAAATSRDAKLLRTVCARARTLGIRVALCQ